MRIRHIEVFHAVYTYGSVTKAALALNVSQPSVSKVLAHAESQLGYPLFDRSGGKMKPTLEAEQLFLHVGKLFDEIGTVRRVAENLKEHGEARLRLAATPAIGMALVPEIVSTYMSRHPGIYFELETLHFSEIVPALQESRIDMAIVFDPRDTVGLNVVPLATGPFVLIKPRQLLLKISAPLKLSELGSVPFVRLNNRGPLGQLLDVYLADEAENVNVVASTETYQIAYGLVERGVGVAIVDVLTARTYQSERVEVVPLQSPLSFTVCALQSEAAQNSILRTDFLDHAIEISQKMLANNAK